MASSRENLHLRKITHYTVSYSTVVLYIGIMKVRGFWPQMITPKPAWYLLYDRSIVLWNESEIEALWLSCIEIWGAYYTSESFVISVMAGWIAEVLFILFCVYIYKLLCNGQNIAEYEANWLIGAPIINSWGARQLFFLVKQYTKLNN